MSEKEIREMTVDEIREELQALIDKMDAPADDATEEEITAADERAAALAGELEKRDAEEKAAKEREEKRNSIRAAAAKYGHTIRSGKGGGNMPVNDRNWAPDSAEYRAAWLETMQGKTVDAEARAAISDAGAVIPTETMNEIVDRLAEYPLLDAIQITHIPGYVSIPAATTVNDAAWVDMATAATDSADVVGAITLGAYKLIKTVSITADVAAMSIDAFETWLVRSLANKLSKTLDAAVINGTGTNQATGLVTSLTASTYTNAGMTYKDLMTIIASLPTEYRNSATFVTTSDEFYGEILGMETTNGDPVVVQDPQAPEKLSILGRPVIVDDNVPEGGVIFGDLSAYQLNFAKDPAVEMDDSVEFRTGSRVYRAMALADGKLTDSNAVVYYVKATA